MTGEVYLCVISCYTKYESKTYRLFMRRNLVGIIVLILLSVRVVNAQTVADSIAIVTAPWEVVTVENGIVHKRASIPFLYQGAQSINILEINRGLAKDRHCLYRTIGENKPDCPETSGHQSHQRLLF